MALLREWLEHLRFLYSGCVASSNGCRIPGGAPPGTGSAALYGVGGIADLVTALLRAIWLLGYVGLLLLLHFYIYSVIGTFAFGDNDPLRFGSLHRSMLTLFQVLTLEGWNYIRATEYLGIRRWL